MKMRTINAAARYFQEADPSSAVTAYAIRQAIKTGVVPAVRAGQKYLVAIENLEAYFSGGMAIETPQAVSGIRAVSP